MNPGGLPYQACLIPNIPQSIQHTVRVVTNFAVVPFDILLAFLSIISNLLVLTVVLRTRSLQHPSLLLLCSLSITDVLWAIFSIVKDAVRFTLRDFCPEALGGLGQGFAALCFFSTLGNLAIISIDRLLAVSKPWWYRNHVTRSRVLKQTSLIWLLSLMMSGLVFAAANLPEVTLLSHVLGVFFYAMFIITMISCYIGIFIANKRQGQAMHQHGGQILATLKREKKLANTVGLILIVLCFTFIPALVCPLALLVLGFTSSGLVPFRPFYHLFITLNGLLNPLLNYGRNQDVRRAVRRLITCRAQCVGKVHPYNNNTITIQSATVEISLRQRFQRQNQN